MRQLFWRRGISGFRKWVNSRDGVTAVSILGLFLILCAMWLIDTVRLHEPVALSQPASTEVIVSTDPDPLMATLAGRELRLSDIIEYAQQAGKLPINETLTSTEVIERGLVIEAINQTLLARAAAQEAAVMADTDVMTKLDMARTRILSAAYLQNVIETQATEQRAVRLYQSQRENIAFGDELKLRHIVVSEEALVRDIFSALADGAEFEQIARDISIDKASTSNNGSLGFLPFALMPPGYSDRVYTMAVGETSEPFKSGSKWVVVRVEGRRPVKPPSFSAVKGEIMEFLKLRAIDDALAELRKEADIVLYKADSNLREDEQETEGIPD